MTRRINQQAGDVLKCLLRQAYLITPLNALHSYPVSVSLLRDYMRKMKMELKHLEEYCIVMSKWKNAPFHWFGLRISSSIENSCMIVKTVLMSNA